MTWKVVDIGSVCLQTNQRDPQREPEKEFVYVDIASVDNQAKRINGTQRILGKDAPSRARKEIRSGDVLVSTVRPNLNAVALVPPELDGQIASTGFCVLRPNPELIHSRYLFYRTVTPDFVNYLSMRVTGANYPAVSDTVVKSSPIPLPPLPIQKQIAAILEKADAAREKRRKANQLTEQFLQSAFLEMFGDPLTNPKRWDMICMKDLCDIKRGASPRPIDKWMRGTVPWIKIGDGSGDSSIYIESTKDFVTVEGAARSVAVPKGSLIFANCGVSLGFARILKIGGCIHDGWLALSNLSDRLNNIYLLSVLNGLTDYFRRIAPGGTQPNLNTAILGNTKIPVPPVSEQGRFAALIEKVESLRAKQRDSEKELENLFNCLMQRACRGDLVRTVPMDISNRPIRILSPTDLHAGILGKVILAHEAHPKQLATLGRVKGEKTCHIIEYHLNRDFGRDPARLAAGPVDFKHLHAVEHRARMSKWFFTADRQGAFGKEYSSGKNLNYLLKKLAAELDEIEMREVDRIIELFVPADTEQAEIAATVYAAWNDLLLEGAHPTDEDILREARENWTPEKLLIQEKRFSRCIEWLRSIDLAPNGTGKHTRTK